MTSSPARIKTSRQDGEQSGTVTSSPARKKISREDNTVVENKQAQRPRSVWFSETLQEICIQEGEKGIRRRDGKSSP